MWTSKLLLIAAASTALLAGAHAQSSFSGDMTSYTLGSTMSGNCNFMTAPAGAATKYAAINSAQWDSTKNCGRCAEVSCADSRCTDKTKTEIVYIVDQCPECKSGDLDVSASVFKTLTGSDPSRFKIQWKFVDCPVTGNLKYCLKSGSNAYFTAIQPANSAAAIKSVTINSKPTTMVASAYYYLLEGNNIDLSALKVSVTSMSGQVVTDTVSLTAGSCATGTTQFTGSSSPTSPVVTPSPTLNTPSSPAVTPKMPTPATSRPTSTPRRTSSPRSTSAAAPTTTAPEIDSDASPTPEPTDEIDTEAPSMTPATSSPSTTPASSVPSTTPASSSPSTTPASSSPSTTPATSSPSTAPAPKTKKPKKSKKTKSPSTPGKDAGEATAGEATTTKKPVSCRRLED